MIRWFIRHAGRLGIARPAEPDSPTLHSGTGERGAVLVLATFATVVALGAAGLAVDLGQAVATKRHLQAVVDLASLEAVRAVGDRAAEINGVTVDEFAAQLAREAAGRNGLDPDAAGTTIEVAVGHFDPATRTFTATTDAALRNAVEVTAGTAKKRNFAPGTKTLTATAVAANEEEAGIALGSYLARLDSRKSAVLNGLLTGLLGGNITLDALSYRGLADAAVELGRLRTALGITAGTVEEFLDTEIALRDLLTATATALTAQGDGASLSAVTPVSTLAAATDPTLRLRLGTLLDVAQGGGQMALGAELNVLQLVQMSAQVADGDHFVSVTLPVTIPGVTSTTLQLALIEAPRIAIGPARQDSSGQWVTRAVTAQLRAQLRFSFLEPLTVLGQTGAVSLPVYLEGGGSSAALTDIRCATPLTSSQLDVHTDGQAIRAAVGTVTPADLQDPTSPVSVADATIAHIPLVVRITGSADITLAHNATDLTFTGPFDWSNTQTSGSTTLGLSSALHGDLDLSVTTLTLGVDALAVADDTRAILAPLFDALDDTVVDPLLSALGISLGGGDTTAWHLDCFHRRLAL